MCLDRQTWLNLGPIRVSANHISVPGVAARTVTLVRTLQTQGSFLVPSPQREPWRGQRHLCPVNRGARALWPQHAQLTPLARCSHSCCPPTFLALTVPCVGGGLWRKQSKGMLFCIGTRRTREEKMSFPSCYSVTTKGTFHIAVPYQPLY